MLVGLTACLSFLEVSCLIPTVPANRLFHKSSVIPTDQEPTTHSVSYGKFLPSPNSAMLLANS